MNGYTDMTRFSAKAVAVQVDMGDTERWKDFADEHFFGEGWAARHNAELWGTRPSGMYDSAAAFALAKTER
jgi:hypothetical protein